MKAFFDFFKSNFFVFEIVICYLPYIPLLKADKNTWWKACVLVVVLFGYSAISKIFRTDSEILSNFIAMFIFLSTFILTLVGIKLVFKSDGWLCTFCGISAYLTQHIFFRIRMLTNIFLSQKGINQDWVGYLYYLIELIAVNFFCWLIYSRKLQKSGELKINNKNLIIVAAVSLVVVNFLNTISMLYSFTMPFVPFFAFYMYALLDCIILMYCLYSNVYVKSIEDEIQMVHSLWKKDRAMYELSKQSMDFLNTKIHDLKYYISGYVRDETALNEINKAINIYGSLFHTDNEVLDVLLSQSEMLCNSKNIQFSCIADGKLLNGISAGDLYSLFCNAIDNAIECLDKVEETEKRSLSIVIKRVNEMAMVEIENYVPDELSFIGGLPQTIKADKKNHGFGVKSMSYIVKKYGGFINFSAEDNLFRVKIILPISV